KLFWITFFVVLMIFARNLNPFDSLTFVGHDETQAARISEFSFNIQNGVLPPRIAPHFSFNLGYPIFNYYAPFAYWITSAIHISGIPIPQSLEISYMFALIVGLFGMYRFLKHFFGRLSGFIGSIAYISSPFIAVDIFVRSNLAEMWFFALFPLALSYITMTKKKNVFLTALILSALFTSHNIFSLISIPIILMYVAIIKNRYAWVAAIGGIILSSYFWLPALGELAQVHASRVATLTEYSDHFLCPMQLWSSPWGYAGSAPGCVLDGMSFMVGKVQLFFAGVGISLFIIKLLKKKYEKRDVLIASVGLLLFASIFSTTESSLFLWKMFEPVLSLFQFPWRFLLFVIFGLAFFTAYFLSVQPRSVRIISAGVILIMIIFLNAKFFKPQDLQIQNYTNSYLSKAYISNIAAFKVPEYVPSSVDFVYWKNLEKQNALISEFDTLVVPTASHQGKIEVLTHSSFSSKIEIQTDSPIVLNIHSAHYWNIQIDGKKYEPKKVDKLGRPIISFHDQDTHIVEITYRQTNIQKVANTLTVLIGIILLLYSYPNLVWKINKKH
ncbi:MAG: 6-pyruvoyl-tetrahydropterin synthase-related protein, partial [Candidatus Roizmanbacteria bacterium]|nr:6-pyruvoyl-tetrahydropterin synthase-related protein [Candidatus Roizmanbacteria bacterium]